MKKIWAGVVLAIMMAAVLTGVWFVEQRHESRGRAAVEEEIQAEWVAEGPENENFEVILRLFMGTKTVAGVDLKMEYSADSLELVPVSANQAVARTPLLKAMVDGKDLLLFLTDDLKVHKSYDCAVWVEAPYFVDYFGKLFDMEWKANK